MRGYNSGNAGTYNFWFVRNNNSWQLILFVVNIYGLKYLHPASSRGNQTILSEGNFYTGWIILNSTGSATKGISYTYIPINGSSPLTGNGEFEDIYSLAPTTGGSIEISQQYQEGTWGPSTVWEVAAL